MGEKMSRYTEEIKHTEQVGRVVGQARKGVFSHSFKERLGLAETLDSRQMRLWLHNFGIQVDLKSSRRQWWLRQTWLGPVRGLAKGILTTA